MTIEIIKQGESGYIQVVGQTWYPVEIIRQDYFLKAEDVKSIRLIEKDWFESGFEEITDRAVERWIHQNCGDFQRIDDFNFIITRSTYESLAERDFLDEESKSIPLTDE